MRNLKAALACLGFMLISWPISAQVLEVVLKDTPEGAIPTGFYFVPADLNGDGRIDFVTGRSKAIHDPHFNRWKENAGEVVLQGHRHDGELLWTFPLGKGIEEGVHYAPFTAYDVDGDGKDEVYAKIADDEFGDWPNRIYSTKEWLVKIDPETGSELKRAPWIERWDQPGDTLRPYSGSSRNMLIIAYVDGENPFVVIERGTYEVNRLFVYDKNLDLHWKWNCEDESDPNFCGSGAHGTFSADVDGDGRDEIILGSAVVDDDGTGMWALLPSKFGHVDMSFTGDLNWDNPGLETFIGAEKVDFTGMVDSRTGKVLWKKDIRFQGFGTCGDVDLSYPGIECTGEADVGEHGGGGRRLFTAGGMELNPSKYGLPTAPANTSAEQVVWWDGSERTSTVLVGGISSDDPFLVPDPPRFSFTADVVGDWREEVMYSFQNKIIVHTPEGEPALKLPNLWTDRKYRTDRARGFLGSGYITRPLPGKRLSEFVTTAEN